MEQMRYVRLASEMHKKDMKLVMDMLIIGVLNIGWWMIYQHMTGFINLKTIRKQIINALR
jgi:hypothetical protein